MSDKNDFDAPASVASESEPDYDAPASVASESEPDYDAPASVASESEPDYDDPGNEDAESCAPSQESSDDLSHMLELEKQRSSEYEEKFKHAMADYQNLSRKTQSDIENGVNSKISEFVLDFLKIYDDLARAKEALSENKIYTKGLDSILKNMDSLLKKYSVTPIDALGKIFDPNLHEAISVTSDSALDDNIITQEIRKGYIYQNVPIRPTLVEISKKG